jgi:hypothetical protein
MGQELSCNVILTETIRSYKQNKEEVLSEFITNAEILLFRYNDTVFRGGETTAVVKR